MTTLTSGYFNQLISVCPRINDLCSRKKGKCVVQWWLQTVCPRIVPLVRETSLRESSTRPRTGTCAKRLVRELSCPRIGESANWHVRKKSSNHDNTVCENYENYNFPLDKGSLHFISQLLWTSLVNLYKNENTNGQPFRRREFILAIAFTPNHCQK